MALESCLALLTDKTYMASLGKSIDSAHIDVFQVPQMLLIAASHHHIIS
jgi:hypothetical protein